MTPEQLRQRRRDRSIKKQVVIYWDDGQFSPHIDLSKYPEGGSDWVTQQAKVNFRKDILIPCLCVLAALIVAMLYVIFFRG